MSWLFVCCLVASERPAVHYTIGKKQIHTQAHIHIREKSSSRAPELTRSAIKTTAAPATTNCYRKLSLNNAARPARATIKQPTTITTNKIQAAAKRNKKNFSCSHMAAVEAGSS